jgi:hypothetical protein
MFVHKHHHLLLLIIIRMFVHKHLLLPIRMFVRKLLLLPIRMFVRKPRLLIRVRKIPTITASVRTIQEARLPIHRLLQITVPKEAITLLLPTIAIVILRPAVPRQAEAAAVAALLQAAVPVDRAAAVQAVAQDVNLEIKFLI